MRGDCIYLALWGRGWKPTQEIWGTHKRRKYFCVKPVWSTTFPCNVEGALTRSLHFLDWLNACMTKLIFLSFVIVYSRNGRGVKPNLAAFLNYSSEVWGDNVRNGHSCGRTHLRSNNRYWQTSRQETADRNNALTETRNVHTPSLNSPSREEVSFCVYLTALKVLQLHYTPSSCSNKCWTYFFIKTLAVSTG